MFHTPKPADRPAFNKKNLSVTVVHNTVSVILFLPCFILLSPKTNDALTGAVNPLLRKMV